MRFKYLITAVLLSSAGALGGCAQQVQDVRNAWSVATSASVSGTSVSIAVNAFDALEATALRYISLPLCGTGPAICRTQAATREIDRAIRAGRIPRNQLEAFLVANPGKLGPTGLYNALEAAVATLQGVLAKYNVES